MAEGAVEKVAGTENSKKNNKKWKRIKLPYCLVICQSAVTTKLRIVLMKKLKMRQLKQAIELFLKNVVLWLGHLFKVLWDKLVRSYMRPIERLGNIGKAFLKIRIKENERNASRFHWIKICDPNIIEVNKFVRLVFGLNQSPLISEGTSKQHFESFLS